eukprot:9121865-Pyramimonas_sp.AAC.1
MGSKGRLWACFVLAVTADTTIAATTLDATYYYHHYYHHHCCYYDAYTTSDNATSACIATATTDTTTTTTTTTSTVHATSPATTSTDLHPLIQRLPPLLRRNHTGAAPLLLPLLRLYYGFCVDPLGQNHEDNITCYYRCFYS